MKKFYLVSALLLTVAVLFSACSSAPNSTYDSNLVAPSYKVESDVAPDSSYVYDEITENGFSSTDATDSTKNSLYFSLDRNTASYSLMRRQINGGLQISVGSVRLEEYVNYFSYNYPRPTGDDALAISGKIFDCPWNSENKLLTVGVAAEEVTFENPKINNIVFLIDVSGSMFGDDRLGLIQQAFTMLTENLNDSDHVSIVTYASGVRTALEDARGTEKTKIANVLQDLEANGSTNGSGGIQRAYEIAEKHFVQNGNNRVILATDGDFNVGISDKDQLKSYISEKRESGIYLTVLGVGMNNTNDSIMKTLAENGNGSYAYLDSVAEARKVLVEELGGTVHVVAKDAKASVTFNPETVAKYRLIGYESKMMSEEEYNDSQKDAGEIGSGHTVTAVFEIQLKENASGNFADAEVTYKLPDDSAQTTAAQVSDSATETTAEADEEQRKISKSFTAADYSETPDEDAVFIGCVVEYGLILRDSAYKNDASLAAVIERLSTLPSVTGENANQFRAEFLELVKKAAEIYK